MKIKPLIKTERCEYNTNLSESEQENDIRLALGKITEDGVEQWTRWCLCRDFFTDTLLAGATGIPNKIYGYFARPEDAKFNCVLIKSGDDFSNEIERNYHILNKLEKSMKFRKSILHKLPDGIYASEIKTPKWKSTTWNLHFYTLFLKYLWDQALYSVDNLEDHWQSLINDDYYDEWCSCDCSERDYMSSIAEALSYEKFQKILINGPQLNKFFGNKPVPRNLKAEMKPVSNAWFRKTGAGELVEMVSCGWESTPLYEEDKTQQNAMNENEEVYHKVHDNFGITTICSLVSRHENSFNPDYIADSLRGGVVELRRIVNGG